MKAHQLAWVGQYCPELRVRGRGTQAKAEFLSKPDSERRSLVLSVATSSVVVPDCGREARGWLSWKESGARVQFPTNNKSVADRAKQAQVHKLTRGLGSSSQNQQLGKHEMIECEWIWDLGPTGRQLWRIKRHGRLNHSSRLFRIQQWKAERTRGPRSGWWDIAAIWGFEGMSKNCCLHFFKVKNFILAQKDLFSLNGPTWSIGKKICSDETMTMALIAGASVCHRQPPRLECRSCHGLLCNPHPTGFPLTF